MKNITFKSDISEVLNLENFAMWLLQQKNHLDTHWPIIAISIKAKTGKMNHR